MKANVYFAFVAPAISLPVPSVIEVAVRAPTVVAEIEAGLVTSFKQGFTEVHKPVGYA